MNNSYFDGSRFTSYLITLTLCITTLVRNFQLMIYVYLTRNMFNVRSNGVVSGKVEAHGALTPFRQPAI